MPNSYLKKEIRNSFIFKNLPWTLKLKNFFGAFQLYEYTVQERNERYILISKECIEDVNFSLNYLEDFLNDFNRENWQNMKLLEQYCEVFKEIDPNFFPKIFLPHKRVYVDKELKIYYEDILVLINNIELLMSDSTELCWRLSKMVDYLREVSKLELMMDGVRLDRYRQK